MEIVERTPIDTGIVKITEELTNVINNNIYKEIIKLGRKNRCNKF